MFFTAAGEGLFGITIVPAIAAAISLIASVAWYIATPKEDSYVPGLVMYLLFTIAAGSLVVVTGGTSSPFIALFMLSAFFAGVFSMYAALPIIIAAAIFSGQLYLAGDLTAERIAVIIFAAIVPLAAGLVVWLGRDNSASAKSDVKQVSTQLSEVASTSEVIINAIGDGVVAIDVQGVIQLINPAAQAILGWSKQDALMLNYKSVLHLTDIANQDLLPADDPIAQALNTNQETRANDIVIVTKSAKKVIAALVSSPIGDAGSGVIVVFRDITKEKAEEREQAEFISTASHEMRTPVASIEGYLGLALNPQTAQIDDRGRDFIMKAHDAAQHLGRLFQDLLDVSKAEDGRLANTPKVVDIVDFVHDIVQGLAPKAQEKGLRITYTPMPDESGQKQVAPIYFVNLDNDHIREITDNLIENAIKYTPAGQIVVDVTANDDHVTISIKDSGIGIPAEDIPHLFQKFYRVDNEDTRQIGGTGLGLYLCRRLTEAMGGRLWLESVYKNGSTFFVELPRISAEDAQNLRQQQAQQATQAAAPAPVVPTMPPVVAAPVSVTQPVPAPVPAAPQQVGGIIQDIKPATTVPRGESLTREQIAAHVARLEALSKNQQAAAAVRPGTPTPPAPQA